MQSVLAAAIRSRRHEPYRREGWSGEGVGLARARMVRASGGDEGGAGGGVEEEEVGEGVGVGGGGVLVVDVIKEGGVDGAAGNGGVGVDDVEFIFLPSASTSNGDDEVYFFSLRARARSLAHGPPEPACNLRLLPR